mmetsp:Transcript_100481/g.215317  ORF Transcript_100481/g.215317 Transcript_100481/m.215317 type:complete len:375 (+) Transcript_100481:94-1218(+)
MVASAHYVAPRSPAWHQRFRSQFLKTKLCRFNSAGQCRYGSDCPFAHDEADLEVVPDLTKTSLCKNWEKGTCMLSADDCPFAHGDDELRATPAFTVAPLSRRLQFMAVKNMEATPFPEGIILSSGACGNPQEDGEHSDSKVSKTNSSLRQASKDSVGSGGSTSASSNPQESEQRQQAEAKRNLRKASTESSSSSSGSGGATADAASKQCKTKAKKKKKTLASLKDRCETPLSLAASPSPLAPSARAPSVPSPVDVAPRPGPLRVGPVPRAETPPTCPPPAQFALCVAPLPLPNARPATPPLLAAPSPVLWQEQFTSPLPMAAELAFPAPALSALSPQAMAAWPLGGMNFDLGPDYNPKEVEAALLSAMPDHYED